MGHNRRNGYSWYTTAPEKLLKKYPEWKYNLSQIIERLAALDIEVRDAQDIETVEKLGTEKKELLERKAELETLEKRKQTALDITSGKVEAKIVESRKGEKNMDFKIGRASCRVRV